MYIQGRNFSVLYVMKPDGGRMGGRRANYAAHLLTRFHDEIAFPFCALATALDELCNVMPQNIWRGLVSPNFQGVNQREGGKAVLWVHTS